MKNLLHALIQCLGDCDESGSEYSFECPRCGTGKRKLGVNLSRMLFNCFKCHWGGRVSDLMEYLGLEAGEVALAPKPAQKEVRPDTPLEIPGFHAIGTDPDADIEKDILRMCKARARLTAAEVRARGWGWSEDEYLFGRMIVPVYSYGQLVQYLARAVDPLVEPKEKCGPTGLGWWSKTDVVYGADAVPAGQDLALVEGMWDYEAVKRAGHHVISLMGTQLGDIALGRILSCQPRRITLFFDGDWAGATATAKIAEKIRSRHFTEIYAARPGKGADPDDLPSEEIELRLRKAPAYFSWLLNNPRLSSSLKR